MASRTRPIITVSIDPEQKDDLEALTKTQGISASFAVREGLRMWLKAKGYNKKSGRKQTGKVR